MKFVTVPPSELPKTFRFPDAFHRFCAAVPEIDLAPWYVFNEAEDVEFWLSTIREWYPARNLIPFARDFSMGDDIACFDGADTTGNPRVYFVHCFADAGWEDRGYVESFTDWEKIAQEEHVDYMAGQVEGNPE